MRACEGLLDEPGLNSAVRTGDVYALMIEWCFSQERMQEARAR